MAPFDLHRLLLEGHRVLAAELAQTLEERGYPDLRPGHLAGVPAHRPALGHPPHGTGREGPDDEAGHDAGGG